MKKYYSVIVLLFILFTLIGVVSAADNNTVDTESQTIITYDDNNYQEDISQIAEKETKDNKETESSNVDDETEGSGCCTTIIQGYNNDSAISFRRDSTYKVTINIKYDNNIIKQYKEENSYFFHAMISKDGWLVGNGGADNAAVNRAIENNALTMINKNTISSTNMNNIYIQENKLSLGHFVIKAPNGTYSLIIKRNGRVFKDSGVLKPVEYLVIPNSINYFKKGFLTTYPLKVK